MYAVATATTTTSVHALTSLSATTRGHDSDLHCLKLPREAQQKTPPCARQGGVIIERPQCVAAPCIRASWWSFGTAQRRVNIPATLSKALCRPCLVYPLASLDVSGQWPVSCAAASPNEGVFSSVAPMTISRSSDSVKQARASRGAAPPGDSRDYYRPAPVVLDGAGGKWYNNGKVAGTRG